MHIHHCVPIKQFMVFLVPVKTCFARRLDIVEYYSSLLFSNSLFFTILSVSNRLCTYLNVIFCFEYITEMLHIYIQYFGTKVHCD